MTFPARGPRGKVMSLSVEQQQEIWDWHVARTALGDRNKKAAAMGIPVGRLLVCLASLKRRKNARVV